MKNNTVKALLGANVTKLRRKSGYSQAAFARMVGISRAYLMHIETGCANPTVDMLERIATGLDVYVIDLFVDNRPAG